MPHRSLPARYRDATTPPPDTTDDGRPHSITDLKPVAMAPSGTNASRVFMTLPEHPWIFEQLAKIVEDHNLSGPAVVVWTLVAHALEDVYGLQAPSPMFSDDWPVRGRNWRRDGGDDSYGARRRRNPKRSDSD